MAELTDGEKAAYTEVFTNLDLYESGYLTKHFTGLFFASLGFVLSEEQMNELLPGFDKDEEWKITLDEILACMTKVDSKTRSEACYRNIFLELDEDEDGFLSKDELMEGLCKGNRLITEEEAEEMIEEMDKNDDGLISFEEFIPYLMKETSDD